MQIVIEIPDAIARRLQPHWSNLTRKVLELLFQAAQQAELVSAAEAEAALQQADQQAELEPNPETLRYMEQQAALYEAQRERLLQTHAGQYIHFEDGTVLDADADFETLILRTFAETGSKDVFIQAVQGHPEKTMRSHSHPPKISRKRRFSIS